MMNSLIVSGWIACALSASTVCGQDNADTRQH